MTKTKKSKTIPKFLLYIPQGVKAGLVYYPGQEAAANAMAARCGSEVVVYELKAQAPEQGT